MNLALFMAAMAVVGATLGVRKQSTFWLLYSLLILAAVARLVVWWR